MTFDPYKYVASLLFNVPMASVSLEQRKAGKDHVLSLGFNGLRERIIDLNKSEYKTVDDPIKTP